PADELRDPVRDHVAARELPGDGEPGADRRVEVAARKMAERRDCESESETEAERDPERPDRLRAEVGRHGDPAEAEEEEEKRSDCFRPQADAEWLIHCPSSFVCAETVFSVPEGR